jgi:hypothetical protein
MVRVTNDSKSGCIPFPSFSISPDLIDPLPLSWHVYMQIAKLQPAVRVRCAIVDTTDIIYLLLIVHASLLVFFLPTWQYKSPPT